MEMQIRREKETGPQTLPNEDRGLFAGSLESLLSRYFKYQKNMVTPNIHRTRATQKTNTRGMGTSTGVDDELATEVVPSINLTNTTHHNTSQHIHSVVLATRDGIMRSQLENKSRRHKSAFGAVVKSTNP